MKHRKTEKTYPPEGACWIMPVTGTEAKLIKKALDAVEGVGEELQTASKKPAVKKMPAAKKRASKQKSKADQQKAKSKAKAKAKAKLKATPKKQLDSD